MKKIAIVVPCYNEEEVLPQTIPVLSSALKGMIDKGKIDGKSFILFVNDGSRDKTWEIISKAHAESENIYGLNLSKNRGHQNALVAGLENAADLCDATVSIDADLQDDVNAIEKMVDKFLEGADVVFGVRDDRQTDSFFKRFTAVAFYKFMTALGVNSVNNHADFRLMSQRATKALLEYEERNLFLRVLVSNLGFKTDTVYYARLARTAGESKYPLKKMLSFAWDGITSFSIKPISLICALGALITFGSVLACFILLIMLLCQAYIPDNAALMVSLWFIGGVQLISTGIIGQYIGKIYIESKHRPRYHVMEFLKHE